MTGGDVVCAIPARYGASRLPGKPLLRLAGRSLIEHVWRRAQRCRELDRVVVLTDDQRIVDEVHRFGGEAAHSPADCRSGTDRIAWAARLWRERAIVNLQGDEPLIEPAEVDRLARHLREHEDDCMVTLATRVDAAELGDPNRVKVVLDRDGCALYFSRAAIPYPRSPGSAPVRRHVGIYGYQRSALLRLAALAPSPLEQNEALEQLRALENGMRIRVLETEHAQIGVDSPEDVARVEQLLMLQESADRDSPPAVPATLNSNPRSS